MKIKTILAVTTLSLLSISAFAADKPAANPAPVGAELSTATPATQAPKKHHRHHHHKQAAKAAAAAAPATMPAAK